MSDTTSDRVTREDLAMFINAAFVCTGQNEFYSSADGQGVSIDFLHQYILINYRRLYTRTLATNINHFNTALVIVNLLATGANTPNADRAEESRVLTKALHALPTQRVFRLFDTLRVRRVNNRRTRAIIRKYMAELRDLPFVAVKYRRRLHSVARHAHLPLDEELAALLFSDWRRRKFTTFLYEQFRVAHYSKEAVYNLPFTIAEGLAAKHKIPKVEFLPRIAKQMTGGEKLRMQKASQGTVSLDLRKARLTALSIYVCSLKPEERVNRHTELAVAMTNSAMRALTHAPLQLGKVAGILDCSYSSSGSTEKRRRPLAVALGASALLRCAASEFRAFWTSELSQDNEIFVQPRGQTDLVSPLLSALEWGAEFIVVVSDGHENDPPGAFCQLLGVYRKHLNLKNPVSVVHLNPVFDSQFFTPKSLGRGVPTLGLRNAEDLLTQLAFARFAEGSTGLSELETFLETGVQRLLHSEKEA